MHCKRLIRIAGTGRMEPARRREQRASGELIQSNKLPQEDGHFETLTRSPLSRTIISFPGRAWIGGRTNTSIGPIEACSVRKASRTHRLI